MRNRRSVIPFLMFLIILLGACQSRVVFHHFRHVSTPGWDKSDTLHFNIPPVTENGTYEMTAELRINKSYPFQKITLIVSQEVIPSGQSHYDVLDCRLIKQNGVIEGDGISYFQYQFHVRDIELGKGDSIHLYISHNMKREIMPGITDVGICLSRTDKVTARINTEEDKQQ